MIEIPSPDERTWKIGDRTALEEQVRVMSDEDLQALLAKLQEIDAKTLRARRLVRAEIERRRR